MSSKSGLRRNPRSASSCQSTSLVSVLGIVLRFAEDATCLGLFGLAAFGLYNRAALALLRARRLVIIGSALGLAVGVLMIAVMDAQMTGEAGAAFRPSVAGAMLTSMPGTMYPVQEEVTRQSTDDEAVAPRSPCTACVARWGATCW